MARCVSSHFPINTSSSDLCFVCQKNKLDIQHSSSLFDAAKAKCLAIAQEHFLLLVQREYYKSQVKIVVNALESRDEADKLYISHYLYDFAQQVHFPFSAQHLGPKYFKTARKCGIFGVSNVGNNTQ